MLPDRRRRSLGHSRLELRPDREPPLGVPERRKPRHLPVPDQRHRNTPVLKVTLGVGGVRDYTWGAAGHLEEVDAAGNVIDLSNDAAGRLSAVSRAIASESAAFAYDGRDFLGSAAESAGGTSSADPVYDSDGLVHALRRKDVPASAEELVVFFYLAGRPVAQVSIDGTAETWNYLTTDHLGTPMLATDEVGVVIWEGGFEPFGTDYQAGTAAGALENGIYLRLPGQWEDESWKEASSGAGVYYNVNRWYLPGVGSYARPDPLGIIRPGRLARLLRYAEDNPLRFYDPLGLDALTDNPDVQDCFFCLLKGANFGVSDFEEAAWITRDPEGNIDCINTGWLSDRGKADWPRGKPIPLGSEAFAHTHPTRSRTMRGQNEPSGPDQNTSRRLNRPVYTVTPNGVWKYDPSTGKVTQELPNGWDKEPKNRCKKKCPEVLQ